MQQEFIFHNSDDWETQGHGDGRLVSTTSPCCADRYLLAVSLWSFSVYAHSWHPFLTRTLVSSDRGPLMWPQLTLIASLNALFPHTVAVRLGLQYMN